MRPCDCDNFVRGKPFKAGMCPACWRFWQDADFHRAACGAKCDCGFVNGTIVEGGAVRMKPLPCVYLGEPTGEWRKCPSCNGDVELALMGCTVHGSCTPAKKLDSVACCEGCPDKTTAIVVPEPPPLPLTPSRDRAIVTVAVGVGGEALLAASGPHMAAYARAYQADFIVLDWPGHPLWPISSKFQIPRVLDHYARIAFVDADILLRPDCMDLFAACAEDEIGLVDEGPFHRCQPQHGREKALLAFRERMGFKHVPHLPWMMNAGVMVVPRMYAHLLMPPTRPIEPEHCAEQDHTCSQILDAYLDGRCKVRLLDRRCNFQSWTDPDFKSAPRDAILHWSGAGHGRRNRAAEIAAWAARYPWPSFPEQLSARSTDEKQAFHVLA